MANRRIRGITLEIGGDVTGLDTALKKTDDSIRNLSGELREVERALKFNPGNMELLGQKSAIVQEQITALSDKMKTLQSSEEQLRKQFEEGKISSEQYRAFQREVETTKSRITDLSKMMVENQQVLDNGGKSVQQFSQNIKQAGDASLTFADIVKASFVADLMVDGFYRMTGAVANFIAESSVMANDFAEQQTKLQQVMRNTMDATDDQVQSIVALAREYAKTGVISAQVQVAGAQELATYLEKEETLKKLIPVMNDMNAQQNGINASQTSAVGIASMLGKVMEGQVGALSRYGYRFDEIQENILKTGTEAERAAVLIDVVSASVGGMNEALAQTSAGKLAQINAELEDT
jgi:chromosome segregation ATPase